MSTNKNDYYHLGLTDDEVLQSREKNGINLLTPPKRPSLWKLYLEKFEDPVVRVLLVAAVFSLIISIIENEYAETIGIIAAILLATGIGFFFEYDASKKFDLLNAVNEETLVKVIRNGRVQEIPRKDIVVGDIVILETGEEIPFCDEHIRVEYDNPETIRVTLPEITFQTKMAIDLGGITAQILHMPATHSPDCTAVLLPEERFIFLGDAPCGDFYGRNGGYDLKALQEMMAFLMEIPADQCCLGHGEPETIQSLLQELQEEIVIPAAQNGKTCE